MEVYPTRTVGHAADLVPENIPQELKTYGHWVVWRAAPKENGKLDKVPHDPKTEKRASTTDSRTWAAFSEALEALESGAYKGLGFMFSSADPYCGVDLDDCRDSESGEITEWAQKIIAAFGSAYREISPSGCGVHIIARGKAPSKKRPGLEIYSVERFFTVTGRPL